MEPKYLKEKSTFIKQPLKKAGAKKLKEICLRQICFR